MALKCAVQLKIPDIIYAHQKPITISELASALQISPTKTSCMQRLLNELVHSGFFVTAKIDDEEQEQAGYLLTPSSKFLIRDNVISLSPVVLAMLTRSHPKAKAFQGIF